MGKFSEMRFNDIIIEALPVFLIGHVIIFFFGVSWLAVQVGLSKAILAGLVPFIPGAIIKTVLASIVHPTILGFLQKK